MKNAIKLVILSLALAGIWSCGNKNSSSNEPVANPVQPVYGYQNGQYGCVSNCQVGNNFGNLTGVIFQGSASDMSGFGTASYISLSASILGDQNLINQIQTMGYRADIYYQGPISISGQINVMQTIYLQPTGYQYSYGMVGNPMSLCQIPAGTYTISLMQPGMTTNGPGAINYRFQNLTAQGPTSFSINMLQFTPSDTNGDRIIDRLNPIIQIGMNGMCAPRTLWLN